MSNAQYVDALIANTGVPFGQADRDSLLGRLNAGQETRASVLRKVAESAAFTNNEKNQAFVMMQYFGYMRRDPDEAGFAFWLKKLNDHGGNFIEAQMVRSFIVSGEYRERFGRN